ncbi:MAG: phosphoribosylanthranilate isomerase [Candidatus Omnitrophota bacterium]
MVKVKICGITDSEDARVCCQSGADALGFIFCRQSPRYIPPRIAKKIISDLSPFISTVGVFVNEDKKQVYDIATFLNLDVLQFHGNEKPAYCNFFRPRFKVIKTFVSQRAFENISLYKVDGYLFDVSWEDKKASKRTLKDSFLRKISKLKLKTAIISGGLTPDNVLQCVKKANPYAVDVARGVELFPGKKDKKLVRLFIKQVKSIRDRG